MTGQENCLKSCSEKQKFRPLASSGGLETAPGGRLLRLALKLNWCVTCRGGRTVLGRLNYQLLYVSYMILTVISNRLVSCGHSTRDFSGLILTRLQPFNIILLDVLNAQRTFAKRRMSQKRPLLRFDVERFLRTLRTKTKVIEYHKKSNIFVQGEPASAVFYIRRGRVKLTVTSEQGKAAIIGVLNGSSFFGEGCIAGQALRMMTATAITDCELLRIEKPAMMAALHERHDFSVFHRLRAFA